MGRLSAVVLLYVMASCALFLGLSMGYEQASWHFYGRPAVMVLAEPDKKLDTTTNVTPEGLYVPVKYIEPTGQVRLLSKFVSKDYADRLVKGEQIPIFFQKDNLQYALYSKDELESPWGWLIVGTILLLFALLASKLRRKEMY